MLSSDDDLMNHLENGMDLEDFLKDLPPEQTPTNQQLPLLASSPEVTYLYAQCTRLGRIPSPLLSLPSMQPPPLEKLFAARAAEPRSPPDNLENLLSFPSTQSHPPLLPPYQPVYDAAARSVGTLHCNIVTQSLRTKEVESLRRQLEASKSEHYRLRLQLNSVIHNLEELQRQQAEQAAQVAQLPGQVIQTAQAPPAGQPQLPTWSLAQDSLRAKLRDAGFYNHANFVLDLEALKELVEWPKKAIQVWGALGAMTAREADLLLYHMQYEYGLIAGSYTPNTFNTWLGYLKLMLRWVAAYAIKSRRSLPQAADAIDVCPARWKSGAAVLNIDDWKKVALKRLHSNAYIKDGDYNLHDAWKDATEGGKTGGNRLADRLELYAMGCVVDVYGGGDAQA